MTGPPTERTGPHQGRPATYTAEPMVADTYLDMAFRRRHGWVALAFGRDGHHDAKGRYTHRDWTEVRYRWPAERDRLLRDVAGETAAGRVDVDVGPALRGDDRSRPTRTRKARPCGPTSTAAPSPSCSATPPRSSTPAPKGTRTCT